MKPWSLIGAALLLLAGCNSNDSAPPGGGDGAKSGDGSTTTKLDSGTTSKPDSPWGNNQPGCANLGVLACADGIDNDGDGLIDAQDPECSGPCDNDEGSFATGIPGDNMDACKQDCFFDGNSGSGDDHCEWSLKCDPKNPGGDLAKPCPYDSTATCKEQVQGCKDYCLPRTPNGCDCFGCCQIFLNGTPYTVYLGSGPQCTASTPDKCAPCTPVASCLNPCDDCELCLGKTIKDLPAKCFPAGDGGAAGDGGQPLPQCSDGRQPCLDNNGCPQGQFCLTGCCIPTIG